MQHLVGMPLCIVLVACGAVSDNPPDAPPGTGIDSAVDGPGTQARCDPAKPFAAATLVGNVNSSNDESSFGLTRDELTAFVGNVVQPPNLSVKILVAQRATATAAFTAPTGVPTAAINNVAGDEYGGSPVSDGLILYFHRQTSQSIGLVAATRTDVQSDFIAEASVTVDGTGLTNALSATISADGQTLYWLDFQDFGKVFAATRGATPAQFSNRRAASVIAIASPPVLSADELTLFYSEGNGVDVFVSTRASKSELFDRGIPVANVNSTANDSPVALTNDGCVLYLSSARSGGIGGQDIWEARRPL